MTKRIIGCLLNVFISTNLYAKDSPEMYLQKALASKDKEYSQGLLKEAIESFPTDSAAYKILFTSYEAEAVDEEMKGNTDSAIKLLQNSRNLLDSYFKAIESLLEPSNEAQRQINAQLRERLDRSREWEERLKTTGKYLDIWRMGNKLKDAGKYREAIEQYDVAINGDDKFDHWVYFNRGFAYQKLGEYQKAAEDYTAAINLDNNFTNAYLGRAECYYQLRDEKAANQDYNRAKELGAFRK